MHGTGPDLRAEKPSLPATLRAVLRLHIVSNLSCMRRASSFEFRPPRSNPLSLGGLPKSPFMAPSCFGVRDRRLTGLFWSRLRPRRSRFSRRSHPWMELAGRPAMPQISPSVLSLLARPPAACPRTCRGARACASLPALPAARRGGTLLPSPPLLAASWGFGGYGADLCLSVSSRFFESL